MPSDDIAEASNRSLEWLDKMHPRAFRNAVRDLIFDLFWPDDNVHPEDVDEETWLMISMNVNEWLIAQGDIRIGAGWQPTVELLLGPRGPRLGPRQREFLGRLAQAPLRLYHVTDVRPGEGLTLVDALDDAAGPIEVRERSASRTLEPGHLLGARLIEVDDHLELSGALYPFSPLHASAVRASLDQFINDYQADVHPDDRSYEIALLIAEAWFAQMLLPPPIPEIIDAATGETLAGSTVRHLTREIDDPRGMLAARHREGPIKPARGGGGHGGPADLSQLDPETMTGLMSQVMRRSYANWADEPIPILDNRSPRELIETPAGLERVKGLLRSYEANEARLAAEQGRAPASFQFLWDAVGIKR
ncbi:MAG: DUF2384 domain-containing protein [Gammaproteobacteria bacterium]|nr:MAG: DUF2384 domain-containing protein [Gammaproteobacteria bacterium]